MRRALWIATGLLALGAARPKHAQACGGTFCDNGPTAMPVDQTGENILFVLDGTTVEAHVQIQYQGAAERFAWIVPMQKIPEVTVGSQILFQNLLAATVPSYGFTTQQDVCAPPNGTGGGGGSLSTDAGGFGTGGSAGSGGGGPTVVFEKTVGSFEVVALQGGTSQEVSDWLVANDYQTIPSAPALLEEYVVKGFVFVALKLTAGADVDEIHPIVFKYEGNEPCVPIKLTAVAATEDMGLRVFFLADDRAVPANYKHVTLNPARINWMSQGLNYNTAVSRAADSPIANGQAFVTEYAGASNVVTGAGVWSPAWNATVFETTPAEQVVDVLQAQGLMSCFGSGCAYNHPLLLPLLQKYLPVPAGVVEDEFYDCLSCFASLIDAAAWVPLAFAADLQARIIDPGAHANALLAQWPYLTRLYTTISPAEMTEDPIFYARSDLPPVALPSLATRRITCDGQSGMRLPDGRQVALAGGGWPAFSSAMPWAEEITEYPPGEAPIVLVDNTDAIDAELAKHNAFYGWPPPEGSGGTGGTGGSPWSNPGDPNAGSADSSAGCACGVAGGDGNHALLLGLAALGLARLRRRRR
jgi:MYXO-CTERM domain-containing protein